MSSIEENLVTYGTPLATDDDEDEAPRKKPVPIDQQIVTDEKGRRRFHGAFTGGFSAGYFNTAGSKEGWAPRSFVSSRSNRAGKGGQQPEDFMDEDDLGAFGIAPRALHVNKDFAVDGNKAGNVRKRPYQANEGPIPGLPPLKDLIVPVSESIGVKLLRKMGWKPGQGIGPRVSLKEKLNKNKPKAQSNVKVYGCSLPEDDDADADELKEILCAPDDIDIHGFKGKENWHGLGYVGLNTIPVLSTFRDDSRRELPVIDKSRKMAITGEAFGVGVYEEDDANIYTVDDMSQYDFELGAEARPSSSDKGKKGGTQQAIGHIEKELEGFHLSAKPVAPKKQFPPPVLPKNFQPFHKSAGSNVADVEDRQVGGLDRHRMNAMDRVAIIDDEPPAEGSVFKHLKPEDRIRLQSFKKSVNTSDVATVVEPASKPVEVESFWSKFSKTTGNSSFKPFALDEDKQKRYEIYLKLKESKKEDVFIKCQPATMTEWEKQREQEEFQRAAVIYKPLSQSMASRFVSEKQPDGIQQPVAGISKEPHVEKSKESVSEIKRETFEWHPDRLLCRRFNIPNPYPESTLVGILKIKRDKYSIFNFLTVPEHMKPTPEVAAITESADDTSEKGSSDIQLTVEEPKQSKRPASIFSHLENAETIKKVPLQPIKEPIPENTNKSNEETRPPMDLFKAIFQDTESENDSSSNEDEEVEQPEKPIPSNAFSLANIMPKSTTAQELTSLQPDKVAKSGRHFAGVFSNIDFDALNSKNQALPSASDSKKLTSVAVKVPSSNSNSRDVGYYGPALPPAMLDNKNQPHHHHFPNTKDIKEEVIWEVAKVKNKHKHKKSKKKKGKHKRHQKDSSDEDTDSSIDKTDLDRKIINRVKKVRKSRY